MGDEELQDTDEMNDDIADDDDGGSGGEKKKKKFGLSPFLVRILLISLGVIGVIGISFGVSLLVSNMVGGSNANVGAVQDLDIPIPPAPDYFTFDAFNLNTADVDIPRFVRLTVVATYTKGEVEIAVELGEKKILLQDQIAKLIASRRGIWLQNAANWSVLQEEIKRKINSLLVTGEVTDVVFQDIIVS